VLIYEAANQKRQVTVRMANGDVHQGRVESVDVDGGFVRLSSNPRLLINLRQAATVEVEE
jgi:sRNA-binding regulator protein Hfq